MSKLINSLIFSFFIFLLTSCSSEKVELRNCMVDVNFSIYKGIKPDLETKMAYEILGDPDKENLTKEWDGEVYDEGRDLYYNYPEGQIIIYASDYWGLGLIEYHPKTNLYLDDIIPYKISTTKKIIDFYCDGDMKFVIHLNEKSNTIKKIDWWNK